MSADDDIELAATALGAGLITKERLLQLAGTAGGTFAQRLEQVVPASALEAALRKGPVKADAPFAAAMLWALQRSRRPAPEASDDFDDEPTARRLTPGSADDEEDTLPRAGQPPPLETTPEVPGRYLDPDDGGREVELGRGGIGRVLLVRDSHLGRVVALKELLPSARKRERGRSAAEVRFLTEARVTAQLEHPGIVPVHELGHRADGSLYYTMKQVRGRSLYERLMEAKTLRGRLRLIPHFAAVCQAMAYAHSRGVVHRDLKPQNVMVGEFGETVVLDWGLAKVRGQRDVVRKRLSRRSLQQLPEAGATVAGHAMGTPAYMSPEQAQGLVDEVDERSDVWSLGAMLFELLTGRIPFEGRSPLEVMQKVVAGEVRSVRALEPGAPPELCAIVERAMRPRHEERYRSAVEVAADVAAFEAGGLVRAHAYSTVELLTRFARRHRTALVSAGIALVLLGALGAWSVQRIRRERDAAERFATLMLTEVSEKLEPVQGSAPVLERVTRAALDFYDARIDAERLDPEQRQRVAVAAQRLGEVSLGVGDYPAAREHLALARRLLLPADDDLAGQVRLVRLELTLGDLEDEVDDRPAALAQLEQGGAEAASLLQRAPGVEEYQMRAGLLLVWWARVARYAGRPAPEVEALLGRARVRLKAIETMADPSVDAVLILVDAQLEAGEGAAALQRARLNFERAPNVERGLQLLTAQVFAGAPVSDTVAWLSPRVEAASARTRLGLLEAAAALGQGEAARARRLLGEALAAGQGLGSLEFTDARGALPGRQDPAATKARALLQALDGLRGAVDEQALAAAVAPFR